MNLRPSQAGRRRLSREAGRQRSQGPQGPRRAGSCGQAPGHSAEQPPGPLWAQQLTRYIPVGRGSEGSGSPAPPWGPPTLLTSPLTHCSHSPRPGWPLVRAGEWGGGGVAVGLLVPPRGQPLLIDPHGFPPPQPRLLPPTQSRDMSPESPAGRLCRVGLSGHWAGSWPELQHALGSRRGPASAAGHLGSAPGVRTAPDAALTRGGWAEPGTPDGAGAPQAGGALKGLSRAGVPCPQSSPSAGTESSLYAGSLPVLRVLVSP